ncbi:hypothetical protein [Bradyrhizobium manausense]|uniref:hypothetical protein n=1 Tax=Bradyrhizobium manausense TaxID=989370 RepID=UPI001BAA5B4E|nr:hypothetical protein [Bradyrhizobium manausense]MBR0724132.1 hypothetical protein [Bradyrhizobium manausense]
MAIKSSDYYFVTRQTGEQPGRWGWEIRRKSKPLGIKMTSDGWQSKTVAEVAGKQALEDFLLDLTKEDDRK